MPAIRRRRGSPAILVRGAAGGLVFCSGREFEDRISHIAARSSPGSLVGFWMALRTFSLMASSWGEQTVGVSRVDAPQARSPSVGSACPASLPSSGRACLARDKSRLARRSFSSPRRSIQPASQRPVDQPRRVIISISICSASSDCLRPSVRSTLGQDLPIAHGCMP